MSMVQPLQANIDALQQFAVGGDQLTDQAHHAKQQSHDDAQGAENNRLDMPSAGA